MTHRQALRRGVKSCQFSDAHTQPGTTPRNPPRDDELTLIEWQDFDQEVSAYLEQAELQQPFLRDSESFYEQNEQDLGEEEHVREYSSTTCFKLVMRSLKELSCEAKIVRTGTTATVANPDFVVVMSDNSRPKPRIVIEHKCPWSVLQPSTTLVDMQNSLSNEQGNKQLLHAIQQLAGYMAVSYSHIPSISFLISDELMLCSAQLPQTRCAYNP